MKVNIGWVAWAFALLFTGLKLGGVIDWRWLWVFAPVWGIAATALAVGIAIGIYRAFFEPEHKRLARLLGEFGDALTKEGRK